MEKNTFSQVEKKATEKKCSNGVQIEFVMESNRSNWSWYQCFLKFDWLNQSKFNKKNGFISTEYLKAKVLIWV